MDKEEFEDVRAILAKLEKQIETGEACHLSAGEAEAFRKVLKTWDAFMLVIRFGGSFGKFLFWLVGIGGAIMAINNGFFAWLSAGLK